MVARRFVFWLLRSTFTLLISAAVCALVVMVPVGRRTLLEHAIAIFSTEPARELGEDLVEAGQALGSRVQQVLERPTQSDESAEGDAVAARPPLGNP